MMRAAERDLVAAEPVRVARAVHALVARPHELRGGGQGGGGAEDPLADHGVLAHERPLLLVERHRACRGSRRGSRPCRCRAAPPPGGAVARSSSRQPEPLRHAGAELGHAVHVVAQARGRAPRARGQGVGGLAAGGGAAEASCGRTSAGRRRAAPPRHRRSRSGAAIDAVRGGHSRSPRRARTGRRCGRRRTSTSAPSSDSARARRTRRRPCGRPARGSSTAAARRAAQALQQRVAGGVAEAVVVALEPVEVEEASSRGRSRDAVGQIDASRSSISARRLARPVRASVSAASCRRCLRGAEAHHREPQQRGAPRRPSRSRGGRTRSAACRCRLVALATTTQSFALLVAPLQRA